MKKLVIVRHAKSSWDLPLEDHNRALMEKGVRRAQSHAFILKENLNFEFDYWVSSFATRALHTACIFADEFDKVNDLNIKKELYTFNAPTLLQQIKSLPNDKNAVILFSHNNACHEVVNQLTGAQLDEFKTASVACMSFQIENWDQISEGSLDVLISKGKISHGDNT